MPATDTDFNTFLQAIRIPEAQAKACQAAHRDMRERLAGDKDIKEVTIATFLQGSLQRATCIAPANGEKSDVDLVVATRLKEAEHSPPALAWQRFAPFLDEHFRKGETRLWRAQGRSVRVLYPGPTEIESVELDLVVTSAPSEAVEGFLLSHPSLDDEDYDPLLAEARDRTMMRKAAAFRADSWKTEPLRIPDRERKVWERTDPLEQIRWTRRKNARTDGHYTHAVMAIKWWQRLQDNVERPKGYPLEAIVGACCPDDIANLGAAIAETFTRIEETYADAVKLGRVPVVPDVGTGLDVLARIAPHDFSVFYTAAVEAAKIARHAAAASSREDACRAWRLLFGTKFPSYEEPLPPPPKVSVPPPPPRPTATVSVSTPPAYVAPAAPARVGNPRFA